MAFDPFLKTKTARSRNRCPGGTGVFVRFGRALPALAIFSGCKFRKAAYTTRKRQFRAPDRTGSGSITAPSEQLPARELMKGCSDNSALRSASGVRFCLQFDDNKAQTQWRILMICTKSQKGTGTKKNSFAKSSLTFYIKYDRIISNILCFC